MYMCVIAVILILHRHCKNYIYIHIESGETSGEIAKQMMDDAGPNVYLKSKPMKIVKSPSSSYA